MANACSTITAQEHSNDTTCSSIIAIAMMLMIYYDLLSLHLDYTYIHTLYLLFTIYLHIHYYLVSL